MPKIKIMDKLSKGEMLLLDGGTGSELQIRGANVLKGATSRLKAWSATANIEFSDAEAIDCPIEIGKKPSSNHPFKGNMDVLELISTIKKMGKENID